MPRRTFRLAAAAAALLATALMTRSCAAFNVSTTLGDGMVLQRAPASAVVWGSAQPGCKVTTTVAGKTLVSTADASGVWRQALPPTASGRTRALQQEPLLFRDPPTYSAANADPHVVCCRRGVGESVGVGAPVACQLARLSLVAAFP